VDERVLDAVTRTIRDWILADGAYKLHTHPQDSRPVTPEDRQRKRSTVTSIAGFHAAATVDPAIGEAIRAIVSRRPDLYPGGWFEDPGLARSYARFLDGTVSAAY
jgi:hypothetical protein